MVSPYKIWFFAASCFILLMSVNSCQSTQEEAIDDGIAKATLLQLLESIEEKDSNALSDIMSTSDEMDLIFTTGRILPSVDSFV